MNDSEKSAASTNSDNTKTKKSNETLTAKESDTTTPAAAGLRVNSGTISKNVRHASPSPKFLTRSAFN